MSIEKINVGQSKYEEIQTLLSIDSIQAIEQFIDPELDKIYDTYLISLPSDQYVLKKAQESEVEAYRILGNAAESFSVPNFIDCYECNQVEWILIEYAAGNDLQILDEISAKKTGESLAQIASYFYFSETPENVEKSMEASIKRLLKLPPNSVLNQAYRLYLERRKNMPRTFVHDDLLPINVLSYKGEITIIDWGYGRKGTYINDVARFHSFYSNQKDSYEKGFSFLAEEKDREIFLNSYFDGLTGELKKQLSKEQFLFDVQLEMLNQYLLNINHLKTISSSSLSSEWETFFYEKATDQAELLLKCRKSMPSN